MKHNKRFTSMIVTILLLTIYTMRTAAQDLSPRIWLTSEASQVTAGQEFTVTVNVAGADKAYGTGFKLNYDPQALEAVLDSDKAVAPGAFFGDSSSFTLKNTADAGIVEYAVTLTQPAQPVSGDGVLGTVKFRALKDAAVQITPTEATLVTPVFAEVNGRLVAQSINQTEAQVAGLTVTVGGGNAVVQLNAPASASVATASLSSNMASVGDKSPNAAVQQPLSSQPVLAEAGQPNQRILVYAAVFFVLGLGLLVISVGMYSKMRVSAFER
jgi:hypothetical protein